MNSAALLTTAATAVALGAAAVRQYRNRQKGIAAMDVGVVLQWPYYVVPPNHSTIRSKKRDFKRELMKSRGVTSGRQWVRIRKSLPPYLRQFTP